MCALISGDGFQFSFAFGVGLSGSHFRCQFGKTPREFDGRFHGDHHRVVKIDLVLGQSGFLQGFLRVALDAAVAFGQDLFVVRDDMPVAGHRDAAAMDDVLLLGLHVDSRHPGIDLVLVRLAVPVGLDPAQFFFGLFADDKEIARTAGEGIQFVNDPVNGILREDGCGALAAGLVADDQLPVLDIDAHIGENGVQRFGFAQHKGLAFALFIGFGDQQRAFRTDGRDAVEQVLAHLLHARVTLPAVFIQRIFQPWKCSG